MAAAVFAVPLAAALVAGSTWMRSYTDADLPFLVVWLPVMGILMASLLLYESVFVIGATFFPAFIAVVAAGNAVEARAFHDRERETSCLVRDVDRREVQVSSTDAEGRTTWRTDISYDYDLDCVAGRPEAMTLGRRVADAGEELMVAYDPEGRLSPRPADDVSDGELALWVCVSSIGVTVLIRGGYELVHRPW